MVAYGLGMALFTDDHGQRLRRLPGDDGGDRPAAADRAAIGGNPAIVCAIGMLSGFCGTLMTPMAANFNIVPAALLELPDRNGVIRAQIADRAAAAGGEHRADIFSGMVSDRVPIVWRVRAIPWRLLHPGR